MIRYSKRTHLAHASATPLAQVARECLYTTTNCLEECYFDSMQLLNDTVAQELDVRNYTTATNISVQHGSDAKHTLHSPDIDTHRGDISSDAPRTAVPQISRLPDSPALHQQAFSSTSNLTTCRESDASDGEKPLLLCPKTIAVSYATNWYCHSSTPSFLICSNCHDQHIKRTVFSTVFVKEYKFKESPRACMFYVERVQKILWPQALTSGDLAPLLAFMKRRVQLKCPGTTKIHDPSIKYFSHRENQPVDGFTVCEACYEDIVVAKSFASKFQPNLHIHTIHDKLACDASFPGILRAFEDNNEEQSWIEAVRRGSRIWQVESCPANRASDTARAQWYKTTQHIEGFAICETCYLNKVVNTPFMGYFEFAAGQWQTGWACDFSAWSVSFAWGAALMKKDYASFWNTANKIMHSPFCAAADMSSEIWYSLDSAMKDFYVCPACYEGIFKSYRYGSYLVPRVFQRDEEKPSSCSMWRESKRGRMYIDKYCEAVDTQQFAKFSTLVTTVASAPVCPRDGKCTNRKWYGYPDVLFCEECYRLFVSETSLAKQGLLELNLEQVAGESFCSIYSPRMREKWLEACTSGNLQPFLDFARHRSSVHSRTAPEVARLLQMMQMRQMMSLSMGMMTMMTHAGDSISNMAGNTTQTWDVTTIDGFHGTGGSEIGAQRQADFERSMAQANGMNEMSRAEFLNQLWKQVE